MWIIVKFPNLLELKVAIHLTNSAYILPQKIALIAEIAQDTELSSSVKLQKLTHLAEMCVDLIQENNEHYSEVSLRVRTQSNRSVALVHAVLFMFSYWTRVTVCLLYPVFNGTDTPFFICFISDFDLSHIKCFLVLLYFF